MKSPLTGTVPAVPSSAPMSTGTEGKRAARGQVVSGKPSPAAVSLRAYLIDVGMLCDGFTEWSAEFTCPWKNEQRTFRLRPGRYVFSPVTSAWNRASGCTGIFTLRKELGRE
jgi:hypothetical protein